MAIKDLREWLEGVDKIGEFIRILCADWNLEVGVLAKIARKDLAKPKALIF